MQQKWMSVLGLLLALLGFLIFTKGTHADANPALTPTATPLPDALPMIETLNTLIADETCELPCWWGWTVGEDSLEDIQEIALANLGKQFNVNPSEETFLHIGMRFPEAEALITIDDEYRGVAVRLWLDQNANTLVAASTRVDFSSLSYVDTSPYHAFSILKKYGTPDQITIEYPGELGGYDYDYYLKFKYHAIGLYIGYWRYMDEEPNNLDESIFLCNSDYIVRLTIWIEPQELELSQEMIFSGGANRLQRPLDRDLEGIIGTDLDTFTEIFSQEDACVETLPINEWPGYVTD